MVGKSGSANQIEADIEKKKELEKSIRHVLKDKARPGAGQLILRKNTARY